MLATYPMRFASKSLIPLTLVWFGNCSVAVKTRRPEQKAPLTCSSSVAAQRQPVAYLPKNILWVQKKTHKKTLFGLRQDLSLKRSDNSFQMTVSPWASKPSASPCIMSSCSQDHRAQPACLVGNIARKTWWSTRQPGTCAGQGTERPPTATATVESINYNKNCHLNTDMPGSKTSLCQVGIIYHKSYLK